MTLLCTVKSGVVPNEFGQRTLAILVFKTSGNWCHTTVPTHQLHIFATYKDWKQMYTELYSKHGCCIGTNLPQSTLWLVSVINKCILCVRFVSEQFVILFVPERIIIYIALKLYIELYLRETRLLLLRLTQFLLREIRYTVFDTSADIDTNVIAMRIGLFTGIKKHNCIYAICSLNLDYISVCTGW